MKLFPLAHEWTKKTFVESSYSLFPKCLSANLEPHHDLLDNDHVLSCRQTQRHKRTPPQTWIEWIRPRARVLLASIQCQQGDKLSTDKGNAGLRRKLQVLTWVKSLVGSHMSQEAAHTLSTPNARQRKSWALPDKMGIENGCG